jgi:UDP-glucose 4-epimerase
MPPVIFGDGLQTRDFIYVEDTAFWLCRIAKCDQLIGQTINLGSGNETSVLDLASLVWKEVGRVSSTPRYLPSRPGDVSRHLAGVRLARKTLKFQLHTSLSQGIRNLVQYLRSRKEDMAALLHRTQDVNWTTLSCVIGDASNEIRIP